MIHKCPGHWEPNADGALRWISGEMWPEEAQALDFAARLAERAATRAISNNPSHQRTPVRPTPDAPDRAATAPAAPAVR
jgi:hypothetical protein